ncbi:hypothetical protein [Brasilonema bromeliae]|uniref:hypothetical protein n=1 Tax=Brasilonema bromeliae TaxID=383615 RepID=UPI0030D92FE0
MGRATAVAFAQAGASVVVAARRAGEGEETVRLAKDAGSEALPTKPLKQESLG